MSVASGTADERATEPTTIVKQFLQAYNAKDFETIGSLIGADIVMQHYGRGVDLRGRAAVLSNMTGSAAGAFPDRRFTSPRRWTVDGTRVAVEHTWSATAVVDVAGFALAGERVEMELCTIFTIRDEQIVEYIEYG